MSKLGVAIKVLRHPVAKRVVTSPQARKLVVRAMKNERVRGAVLRQVKKRLFR